MSEIVDLIARIVAPGSFSARENEYDPLWNEIVRMRRRHAIEQSRLILKTMRFASHRLHEAGFYQAGDWSDRNIEAFIDDALAEEDAKP